MAALCVSLLAACGSEVTVRQIQDLAPDCSVPKGRSAPSHSQGTLDVAFAGDYVLTPLLESDGATEVTGAIVRLYETSDPSLAPESTVPVLEFFSYAEVSLDSGDLGTLSLTVIPSEYTVHRREALCGSDPSLAAEDLVLVGVTFQDSSDAISEELFFPVTLCCGCLVSCPPEADLASEPAFDCCSDAEVEEEACAPGQDVPVDCRLCRTDMDPRLSGLCRCGFAGACPGEEL
jgi:hypothetical protein